MHNLLLAKTTLVCVTIQLILAPVTTLIIQELHRDQLPEAVHVIGAIMTLPGD